MFDTLGNIVVHGLTLIGNRLGLEMFEVLTLVGAIAGAWLFLLRARMYANLAKRRRRNRRSRQQQSGQRSTDGHDDQSSPTPTIVDAIADTSNGDQPDADPPLLRQIRQVPVQSPTAQDDDDSADADANAADNDADAPWLRRDAPVVDPVVTVDDDDQGDTDNDAADTLNNDAVTAIADTDLTGVLGLV